MIITIEQAARHLRIDDIDDSEVLTDLTDKCVQVTAMVLDYLELDAGTWQDSSDEPLDVPGQVQAAALIWLGYLWNNRNGEDSKELETGYIPRAVSNLLWRMKRFPIA